MSESVTREIVLPLEREEAWRVVTEPDHLREWLADDVEIELVEGGQIEIGLDDAGDGTRVTVVETGFEALEPTSMAGCAAVSTWIWDVRLGACGDLPLMLAR